MLSYARPYRLEMSIYLAMTVLSADILTAIPLLQVIVDHGILRRGNEAVLAMVRAGMGTALLPRLAILSPGARADESLSVQALQPPLPPREIFLLRESRRTHSPLAARVIEIAADVAREDWASSSRKHPARGSGCSPLTVFCWTCAAISSSTRHFSLHA